MIESMKSVFQTTIEFFWGFNGTGMHLPLFFLAILYLIAVKKKGEEKQRTMLVGYSLLFAVVYLCPVTAYIIMRYCIGEKVYWRMFWLLPFIIMISYVLVRWLFQTESKKQFAFFVVAAVLVLRMTGSPVYTEANFYPAENAYKIPQNVVAICDFIEEDYPRDDKPKVTVPNELVCYIRQYDAGIKMPYGRNALTGSKLDRRRAEIYEMMSSGDVEWERMIQLLKEEKSHYLIYPLGTLGDGAEELEREGYLFRGDIGGYGIYRCDDME